MKELGEVLKNGEKFAAEDITLSDVEVLKLQKLVEAGTKKLQEQKSTKNIISYKEIMESVDKGSKYIVGTVLGGDKMKADLMAGFRTKMRELRK